jgi:hypothetical protein
MGKSKKAPEEQLFWGFRGYTANECMYKRQLVSASDFQSYLSINRL